LNFHIIDVDDDDQVQLELRWRNRFLLVFERVFRERTFCECVANLIIYNDWEQHKSFKWYESFEWEFTIKRNCIERMRRREFFEETFFRWDSNIKRMQIQLTCSKKAHFQTIAVHLTFVNEFSVVTASTNPESAKKLDFGENDETQRSIHFSAESYIFQRKLKFTI
jgi:hypothetical protein